MGLTARKPRRAWLSQQLPSDAALFLDAQNQERTACKPFFSIEEFNGHPCLDYPFGLSCLDCPIPADASAAFGIHPKISYWEMAHGAGGGVECVDNWVDHMDALWNMAGNVTQWQPKKDA